MALPRILLRLLEPCVELPLPGGVAAAVAEASVFGLPDERLVRTVISLGYPDAAARAARPRREQVRKPLDEIVHRERYGLPGRA